MPMTKAEAEFIYGPLGHEPEDHQVDWADSDDDMWITKEGAKSLKVHHLSGSGTPENFREAVEDYVQLSLADKTDDVQCDISTMQDRAEGMIDFAETYGGDVAEAISIVTEMMACDNGFYASGARYIGDFTKMQQVNILCDGGSKNNGSPDSVAYGSYITNTPKGQFTGRLKFERGRSNNQAEYAALIASLEDFLNRLRIGGEDPKEWDLTVQTDSQLVIGHLTLNWCVGDGQLMPYVVKAMDLVRKFHNWQLNHIPGTEVKKILGH